MQGGPDPLAGAFPTVNLQQLLCSSVQQALDDLRRLPATFSTASDADRREIEDSPRRSLSTLYLLPAVPSFQPWKRTLLLHLHATRQRLLRLFILGSWDHRAKVLREAGRILDITKGHADAMRMAADHLAHLHSELEDTRAPSYDVATALEVLQTGAYNVLPAAIEDLQGPKVPPAAEKRLAAVHLLHHWLRVQLLQEGLPKDVAVDSIQGGFVTLRSRNGAWEAKLTLVAAPNSTGEAAAGTDSSPEAGARASQAGGPSREGGQPSTAPEHGADTTMEDAGAGSDVRQDREAHAQQAGSEAAAGWQSTQAQFDTDGPDKWRWRLVDFSVLPGHTHGPGLAAAQAQSLRSELDSQMWAAAEAGPAASTEPLSSREHQPPGPDVPAPMAVDRAATPVLARSSSAQDPLPQQQQGAPKALEARKPLQVLEGVLREVASRLALLHMSAWVSQQARDASMRWHRHIAKVDRLSGSRLEYGMRVLYWQQAPWITPQEAEALVQGSAAVPTSSTPGSGAPQPGQHILEVGDTGTGALTCATIPALPPPPSASEQEAEDEPASELEAQAGNESRLDAGGGQEEDVTTAGIEGLLLRAAAANAAVQLGAIEALLSKSPMAPKIGFKGRLSTTAVDDGACTLQVPELELWAEGQVLLRISIQLHTGLLLLASREGSASTPDAEPITSVAQDEAKLRQVQAQCLAGQLARGDREKGMSTGQLAVHRVAGLLAERLVQQVFLNRRTQLMHMGARAALSPLAASPVAQRDGTSRPASLPAALMEAYWQANPRASRCSLTHITTFAFPPCAPLPPSISRGVPSQGLAFYLVAEMQPRSEWNFWLLGALTSPQGTPQKVVKWSPVPKCSVDPDGSTPALAAVVPSQEHNVLGKRKRDGEASPPAQSGTAAAGHTAAHGQRSSHGLLLHQLGEAVKWCHGAMLQCQLQLHLQALGILYHIAWTCSQSDAAAQEAASRDSCELPERGSPSGSGTPAVALDLSCWQLLSQLDEAALRRGDLQPQSPDEGLQPGCGIRLKPVWEGRLSRRPHAGHKTTWAMEMSSRYLAGLPETCGGCPQAAPPAATDAHMASAPQGLHLRYVLSAGGLPLVAMADAARVTRLHGFLARSLQLMHSQEAQQEHQSRPQRGSSPQAPPSSTSTSTKQPPAWEVEDTAFVRVTAVGPTRAAVSIYSLLGAADEKGEAQKQAAEQPTPGEHQQQQQSPLHQNLSSRWTFAQQDLFSAASGLPRIDSFLPSSGWVDPLSSEVDPLAMSVDPLAGPMALPPPLRSKSPSPQQSLMLGRTAMPASPFDALMPAAPPQPGGEAPGPALPLPIVTVGVEWVSRQGPASPGIQPGAGELRCRLQFPPGIPQAIVHELEALADAGEEELLLDALCICMEPLKVMASVLTSVPAAASPPRKWLPDDVSLVVLEPPFHLQLSCPIPAVSGQADRRLVLDIRLMCKGLVWIGFPLDTAGPDSQLLSSFKQSLSAMSGVSFPRDDAVSDLTGPGLSDNDGAPLGLWVKVEALESVLTSIFNPC